MFDTDRDAHEIVGDAEFGQPIKRLLRIGFRPVEEHEKADEGKTALLRSRELRYAIRPAGCDSDDATTCVKLLIEKSVMLHLLNP